MNEKLVKISTVQTAETSELLAMCQSIRTQIAEERQKLHLIVDLLQSMKKPAPAGRRHYVKPNIPMYPEKEIRAADNYRKWKEYVRSLDEPTESGEDLSQILPTGKFDPKDEKHQTYREFILKENIWTVSRRLLNYIAKRNMPIVDEDRSKGRSYLLGNEWSEASKADVINTTRAILDVMTTMFAEQGIIDGENEEETGWKDGRKGTYLQFLTALKKHLLSTAVSIPDAVCFIQHTIYGHQCHRDDQDYTPSRRQQYQPPLSKREFLKLRQLTLLIEGFSEHGIRSDFTINEKLLPFLAEGQQYALMREYKKMIHQTCECFSHSSTPINGDNCWARFYIPMFSAYKTARLPRSKISRADLDLEYEAYIQDRIYAKLHCFGTPYDGKTLPELEENVLKEDVQKKQREHWLNMVRHYSKATLFWDKDDEEKLVNYLDTQRRLHSSTKYYQHKTIQMMNNYVINCTKEPTRHSSLFLTLLEMQKKNRDHYTHLQTRQLLAESYRKLYCNLPYAEPKMLASLYNDIEEDVEEMQRSKTVKYVPSPQYKTLVCIPVRHREKILSQHTPCETCGIIHTNRNYIDGWETDSSEDPLDLRKKANNKDTEDTESVEAVEDEEDTKDVTPDDAQKDIKEVPEEGAKDDEKNEQPTKTLAYPVRDEEAMYVVQCTVVQVPDEDNQLRKIIEAMTPDQQVPEADVQQPKTETPEVLPVDKGQLPYDPASPTSPSTPEVPDLIDPVPVDVKPEVKPQQPISEKSLQLLAKVNVLSDMMREAKEEISAVILEESLKNMTKDDQATPAVKKQDIPVQKQKMDTLDELD